jgi:hypothetical protein
MEEQLRRQAQEIRRLKVGLVALAGLLIVSISKPTPNSANAPKRTAFEEIDVQRLNVVEKDGTVRTVIANTERFPDPLIGGKERKGRAGDKVAGLIFYNDAKEECGGLVYNGRRADGKANGVAGLVFDQFGQDQTLGMSYVESNGRRSAFLQIWDRPDAPVSEYIDILEAAKAMPAGPEQNKAMAEIAEKYPSAVRFFAGKTFDRAAAVYLADAKGRPRIMLHVTAEGEPKIEFLDETGKVTMRLPPEPEKK